METMLDLDCSTLRTGSAADFGRGWFVFTAPSVPAFVCVDSQDRIHTFALTGEDRFVFRLAGRRSFLGFAAIVKPADQCQSRYGLRIVPGKITQESPPKNDLLGALCMTPHGCVLPVVDAYGDFLYVALSSGKEIEFSDAHGWWFATEWKMSIVCYGVTETEIAKRSTLPNG